MKLYKKIALCIGCASIAASAFAQSTYSGYFLDNYLYRSEMNPAFGGESSYVGFPGLGNINIGMQGNLHLTSVLYNVDGKTSLFTNPNVSAAEVMSDIHDKNRLGVDTKLNIINVGFKGIGGYNTISINARASVEAQLPGSLFSLLKEGISNQTYNISNLRARGTAFAEIALNHSHDIKAVPGLRVGGTVKFLLGGGRIDARFNQAELTLGTDSWDIRSNAIVEASVKGFKYKTEYDHHADRYYVNGGEIDGAGLNGFGLGFDLGAEYKWKDFSFSAALLDLGFISWSNTATASTVDANGNEGTCEFQTSKYTFGVTSDENKSEWDSMRDELSALYELKDFGNTGSRTTGLAATLNLGAQYTLPMYRRLSFGLVNSTRLQGQYTWTQFRLSANIRPIDCLSASVNLEAGTFGAGFGWLFNLNTRKGFSLFLGMDHTLGKLAKQGVPLNSNAKVNFGMNFPF